MPLFDLFSTFSPMGTALFLIFLGCGGYLLGGVIGFYSIGYGNKEASSWLEENKDNFTTDFYTEEKTKLIQNAVNKTISITHRLTTYRLMALGLLGVLLLVSPNWVAFTVLSVIFFTLLWLSSVDIDSHTVPEKALYAMTVTAIGFSSLSINARWSDAESVLFGTFITFAFVSLSIALTKWLMRITKKSTSLIFGDGDVLILVALSLYFGVDTLIGLGIGSFFFVIASLFSRSYFSLLRKTGHLPVVDHEGEGMAFVPFIFIGMLMMVVLNLTHVLNFSLGIDTLHRIILLS